MADDTEALPATGAVEDSSVSAPATDTSSRSDISADIKSALEGGDNSKAANSPRELLRKEIETELEGTSEGRARGPDGKFIPKEASAAPVVATGDVPADPATETPAVADAAPTAWKKDIQAKWAEIPDWARAEITKREADVEKGFAKYATLRQVEPVLDWANRAGQQLGLSGPQLVHSWATFQSQLMNPATATQAVAALIRQYNVHPPAVLPHLQGQQGAQQPQAQPVAAQADPNGWVDPQVAALEQKLAQFEQWKTSIETGAQQAAQQRQQYEQQNKLSAIDQFSSEKDASGQPLRPHLEAAMPDMVASIAHLKATKPQLSDQEVLQEAYDRAVYANPDTRKQVLEAQRLQEETERKKVARERAQAAARGAVSPASSSPQGSPAPMPPKGSLNDQIRHAYEQATA